MNIIYAVCWIVLIFHFVDTFITIEQKGIELKTNQD